ncbi:Os02g0221800 [Oryza sativa Japonica Group]|uniref:Os02g0221800 protein n=3 Tax=Oryza TaxID=4527 RepID=A0A0P0VGM2_ORYSJ|nr:Os02g0221800 [Oryza sativa Japonica Group]
MSFPPITSEWTSAPNSQVPTASSAHFSKQKPHTKLNKKKKNERKKKERGAAESAMARSPAARKPSAAQTVAVTLALALASAGLLFLLFHLSPSSPTPHPHPHRRLRLRGARASPSPRGQIPFDPVIAGLERRRDDREWERLAAAGLHAPGFEAAPVPEDYIDGGGGFGADPDEDYINDAARFNLTRRVEALFPKIDVDPADGAVTPAELTAWNLASARREVMHRTARELDLHDRDHDGRIAFSEYERPSWAWRFDDHNSSNDGVGWWKEEHFNASDMDGDGFLNLIEFNDFLHPADTTNPKLINWLCKEEVRERDKDNDGKLNFQEFYNGLFYSIRHFDEEASTDDSNASDAPARKSFTHLDLDNDGLLSADELKPIIGNLHPPEHFYAKQQADYVITQADTNKDGQLSLQEMIENPYVFYSALFTEDDYGFHDELR